MTHPVPLLVCLALALVAGNPSVADSDDEAARATIVGVDAGLQIQLSTGDRVQLGGLWAPEPARLRAHLGALDTSVTLAPQARPDRYGVLRGDLIRADGEPLSVAVIEAGLALAWAGPFGLPPPAAWSAERAAECAGRGIWQTSDFLMIGDAVLADWAQDPHSRFAVVRARIRSVGSRTRWTYLNFGADWSRDLTVKLRPAVRDRLAEDGIHLPDLAGRWVEVRGWLFEERGPAMSLEHAAHLRVVAAEGATRGRAGGCG